MSRKFSRQVLSDPPVYKTSSHSLSLDYVTGSVTQREPCFIMRVTSLSLSFPRRTCHRFLRECIVSWTTCASTDCAMEAFRREHWNYSSASPLPRSQTTAHPSQGRRSLLRWSCLAFRQGPAWDLSGGGVLWEPQGFVPQLRLCLFQLDFTRLPMIKRPKLLSRNSSQISWCDSERCGSWESEQCFPHCLLF